MGDKDLKPNNPLSPYYPSDIPDVPGNGRKWFAVLFALIFLSGALYQLVITLL